MIGRPMRFQGRGAVVDLEYEDVVRILLETVMSKVWQPGSCFTAAAAFSLSAAR